MQLTIDQTMTIYQRAIDKTAGADEGEAWWSEVQTELEAVIAAPTTAAAAAVIASWHRIWKEVNDTPARASSRIRTQAARLLRR